MTAVFPRVLSCPLFATVMETVSTFFFLQINTALECDHHSNYCLNYRSMSLHTYPFIEKNHHTYAAHWNDTCGKSLTH